MQIQSKKFLFLSLALLTVLGGCSKKEKSVDKKSSSCTPCKKSKRHKKASQAVDAFELDQDSLATFALDDQLSKHHTPTKAGQTEQSPLFSWENLNAEESKHQFKTLHFDFDKEELRPTQHAALKQDIDEAKKMIKKGKIIVIEGHACHSAGSAIYNLALSERRARYVAQKFAEAGIDAANIKIAPRGQEMPVRKGGSREEQWVNRRVEIYAIDAQ
jgi:outer membrane protein OmpA-like peptidoglycan-associated protein